MLAWVEQRKRTQLLPAGADAELGVGLLATDIADADAVFAKIYKGEVLAANARFGQVDGGAEHIDICNGIDRDQIVERVD